MLTSSFYADLAPPTRAALARVLGQALAMSGRGSEARTHFDGALRIAREVGNRAFEGNVLRNLGTLRQAQGRNDEARAHFDAGEALLRAVNGAWELGKLLCGRALLEHAEGQVQAAKAALDEAEALAARIGAGEGSELGKEIAKARAALEDP